MAMTYAEFTSYLTTFLWKQNDLDLVANIDNLIRMANAELNTKLDLQRRQTSVVILPETEDYVLPADFRTMRSLTNNDVGTYIRSSSADMKATTANDINNRRASGAGGYQPYYYVDREGGVQILRLIGPFSAQNPGNMTLVYRTGIPDYATDDASWVEDLYLDLYTYTVLSHCAPFLREDERIPVWAQMKTDALAAALVEDAHGIELGGSPMTMQPHRPVPNTRDY